MENIDKIDKLSAQLREKKDDSNACLALCDSFIEENPHISYGYSVRHEIYRDQGDLKKALSDCNSAIRFSPSSKIFSFERAVVHQLMQDHPAAIADYTRAFALDDEGWFGSFGRFYRAHSYAQIGDREHAMADWDAMSEDHWTPGFMGLPRGNKSEVKAALERSLAAAKPAKG